MSAALPMVNKLFKSYDFNDFEVDEIENALSCENKGEFDIKVHILFIFQNLKRFFNKFQVFYAKVLSRVQSYRMAEETLISKVYGAETNKKESLNPRQYEFSRLKEVKLWRCPNRLFTFPNDSDTLKVTGFLYHILLTSKFYTY